MLSFFFSKKLTIQIDSGQAISDNRLLTHNLAVTSPRSQTTASAWLPRTVRTSSVTTNAPILCPCFQLKVNRESQICFPNHHIRCFTFSEPTFSSPNHQPARRAYLRPFSFDFSIKFSYSSYLPLSPFYAQDVGWLLCCSERWINSFRLFSFR